MPKQSPKVNTLLTYFSKTPKTKNNDETLKNSASNKTQTPKSTHANSNSPKQNSLNKGNKKSTPDFELYDVVWAKLEGYPWWPALVSNNPTTGSFYKPSDSLIHVQFFDDPISRSWIKRRLIKDFAANRQTVPKMTNPKWKAGVEEADKAVKMERSERSKLIVTPDESDMEVDDEVEAEDTEEKEEDDSEEETKENVSPHSQQANKPKLKRRRIMSTSSDGSTFEPEGSGSDSESISSGEDESKISEVEPDSEPESPVKTPRRPQKRKMSSSTTPSFKIPSTPSTPKTPKSQEKAQAASDLENKIWAHLQLDWLKPDKIRDKKGRSPSHPEYDEHSLFVPESFMKSLTPGMRQWWELKSSHFDTILFFKVGKFYELYHMDAVIGVQELGLTFMKGEFAHSGFPEIGYSRFAPTLIQKGYKVARVEQTETPQMMEERCKKLARPTKFDKVVNREICRITTKGTQTFSVLDGDPQEPSSAFLLALAEKGYDDVTGGESEYGICFIDTSIGKFHLGQFKDDRHCSQLRTLVAHYPPVQVLHERGGLSQKTQGLLRGALGSVLKEALRPGAQFWEAHGTLSFLAEKKYFSLPWPDALAEAVEECESIQRKAKPSYELAIRALGACLWYLRDCCIVDEILSMKCFELYHPVSQLDLVSPSSTNLPDPLANIHHMVLDGVALSNLEVLENSVNGSSEGTLLGTLDFCTTHFGKRLFRQWLCSPLFQPAAIVERQDAIEELSQNPELAGELCKTMVKLPDLERLLSKIHTQGCSGLSEDHPDSRAIFYEADQYSKRKITDFITVLQGFTLAKDIIDKLSAANLSASLIRRSIVERFPDLTKLLEFFRNAFDHEKAKKDGKIIPSKGVDQEYDDARAKIKECKQKLDDYLDEQRKHFGTRQVTYFGSGRTRFQLEVPESACNRATDEHDLLGQRKGFRRYWTEDIKALLAELTLAEEHQENALKDIMRRIFETFDKDYAHWEKAVQCLAMLDALLSLAQYKTSSPVPLCRPELVTSDKPFLEIREGRHPTLVKLFAGDDLIPNDILIGIEENDEANLVLVTGPNMGGKSTLMRQAGLLLIMAQMGSFVPADLCRFSPADRIFTRLGASDKIMAGESTFFIEVSETASILKYATKHSLVLLDELGRGTSTYDGAGIACAVVEELASSIKCRTLFSTHYHTLVDQFAHNPHIKLGHMACMVENEDHPTEETITFLYKFVDGDCPKSYGFNAARLAGMPTEIVTKARQKAKQLEDVVESRRLFKNIFNCNKPNDLQNLLCAAA